jgi:isocitrate lyase
MPEYKVGYLALLRRFHDAGIVEINGHLLHDISDVRYEAACRWFGRVGILDFMDDAIAAYLDGTTTDVEAVLDQAASKFLDVWQAEAGLKTFGEAVAEVMAFHNEEGGRFEMTVEEWVQFAGRASQREAQDRARLLGINIIWDAEICRTPEGYYQVQGGIPFAIAKSLAAAPFADIIWMETKTANLDDAREFAEAIHAEFPDKMLAYNLSPSFNWDTTGMTDEEMREFPRELGKLGYVFNFITYGGHQIDGLAAEEFATALQEDGMLALARLQRRLRLLDSPYKTPQSHVGGPRLDGALMAATGRTATTKAMGKGSTQFQHLVQTEVLPKLLDEWLQIWSGHYDMAGPLHTELRPHTAGTDLLSLSVTDNTNSRIADVIFAPIQDRRGRDLLSVRDQNTHEESHRKKRLMTLIHLFLVYRYKAVSVHYVSPTDDNLKQTERMKTLGIYEQVNTEVGHIIVASVNSDRVKELVDPDRELLRKLIAKEI